MLYPDYENGLVNLISSILKHYGVEPYHSTLPTLDIILKKDYKNIVLMLFDGMGTDILNHHLQRKSYLRKHFQLSLSSVFPPTTTAAVTTLSSGLTPAEHGWLGWSLYFSEVDKVVNAFINTEKGSGKPAASYHVGEKVLAYQSVYEQINETGNATAYNVSKFGTNVISKYEELFQEIERLCSQGGKKYIYSYWEEPDTLMHDNGCYAPVVTEYIKKIDKSIEALCNILSDTLIIVTADHGHTSTEYFCISDYPMLERMLYLPVSVESRAAAFYVKEEFKNVFKNTFYETFGEAFLLLSQEEIIEQKIFGNGIIHPKFSELTGDFLAIAISNKGIVQNHYSSQLRSNHAGMTEKEMLIPFIICSSK